jgi:hypothetical protein
MSAATDPTQTAAPQTASTTAAQPTTIVEKVEEIAKEVIDAVLHPGATNTEPTASTSAATPPVEPAAAVMPPVEPAAPAAPKEPPLQHTDTQAAELHVAAVAKAAKAPQRVALGNGAKQAGNAMDTMHGKVNATWPSVTRPKK